MSAKLKDKNLKLDKKRLRNSFKYAFQGVKQTYIGEQNMKLHTIIAIIVVVCGFVFKISYMEWLICLVLICLVLNQGKKRRI